MASKQKKLSKQVWAETLVAAFSVEEWDMYGAEGWQPFPCTTDFASLERIYAVLPAVFPPLYEYLVLSYRWPVVELLGLRLLANPPGPGLEGLLAEIRRDKGLWEALTSEGYIQFARPGTGDYDPICFDTRRRQKDRDCPIVQIDHEEILCNGRIRVVAELAESFRELIDRIFLKTTGQQSVSEVYGA